MITPLVQEKKKLEQADKTVINWSHETWKRGKASWRRWKGYHWEHSWNGFQRRVRARSIWQHNGGRRDTSASNTEAGMDTGCVMYGISVRNAATRFPWRQGRCCIRHISRWQSGFWRSIWFARIIEDSPQSNSPANWEWPIRAHSICSSASVRLWASGMKSTGLKA